MEGRNREMLRVYGRAGEPCLTCATPIARIVVGGRGTHLCLNCQPVPGAAVGGAY
jgi:formamidopyrimidine-DNA glycosylase